MKITSIDDYGTIVMVMVDQSPFEIPFDHRMFYNMLDGLIDSGILKLKSKNLNVDDLVGKEVDYDTDSKYLSFREEDK